MREGSNMRPNRGRNADSPLRGGPPRRRQPDTRQFFHKPWSQA